MREAGPAEGRRFRHWSEWNRSVAERPWTVGVEEEVVLIDPVDGRVANRIDEVLAVLAPEDLDRAAAETHACVIELRTGPHDTVGGAAAELAGLRRRLERALRERLGLRACVAGTHPLATRAEVAVSSAPRYRLIESTMRTLAQREPTMALHIHVAVPDGPTGVRALDGLRADLPLVLALSANSPFWQGADSGFASVRTPIFSMFPRVGIPRRFGSYGEYVRTLVPLVRSGAIPDPGFVWWDARLQPRHGTVEVRIADAQSRVADTAALAALVQCLVRRHAEGRSAPSPGDETLAENRFLAARDGTRARLIDEHAQRRHPLRDVLDAALERCDAVAPALGCRTELGLVAALADDPGEGRQRDFAAEHGPAGLPTWLAGQFSGTGVALTTA